ncbi:MAG: GtrA family protein [Bacteroidales bacterium]|nr:GtrA family protein [Bacteroidales bacterium]MBN2748265.1 GtrA family protein [Bacteroidales bacterium]
MFLKFLKFCVVGGSGVFVDFGFTYVSKEVLKINKYISNSIGFIIAASSNYILNRIWTFASNDVNISGEYFRFMIVSAGGLLINNAILWLLHGKFGYNFYLSKIGAIAGATLWNFLLNYLFTFN